MGIRCGDRGLNAHSLGSLCDDPTNGPMTIDLSSVRFVDPHGVALLAVQIDHATRVGIDLHFTSPRNNDAANYLSRIGVRSMLMDHGFGPCGLPSVDASPLENVLVELSPAHTENDFDRLTRFLFNRLSAHSAYTVDIVCAALGELGNNVAEHAGATGYVVAQVYNRGKPNEEVAFAVGDAGIGIRAALAAVYAPASDDEALDLAMTEGVSGTGDQGRGIGLHQLHEDISGHGGSVWLASGTAIRGETSRKRILTKGVFLSPLQGTILSVRVPTQPGT